MIPKKRKRPRMGVRKPSQISSLEHLRFVRSQPCLLRGRPSVGRGFIHECYGPIQAAHVRTGTDGGAGIKPSDCYTVPLCVNAHGYQHNVGEGAFEKTSGLNLRKIADALWARSPARAEVERKRKGM